MAVERRFMPLVKRTGHRLQLAESSGFVDLGIRRLLLQADAAGHHPLPHPPLASSNPTYTEREYMRERAVKQA